MTCRESWAHEALEQWALGELEPEALARLREHAAGCPECRQEYDRHTRVEAFLAGVPGGLSQARQSALQAQLLARLATASAPATATATATSAAPVRVPKPPATAPRFFAGWRMLLAPAALAVAALAVVVFVPRAPGDLDGDGYQPRAGGVEGTWGVRAFCVTPRGEADPAIAEAGPGETLSCAPGSHLAFTATAPRAAQLSLELWGEGGAARHILPAGDPAGRLGQGVDMPLEFSTQVSGDWLFAPTTVRARFVDPGTGELLGESALTLAP